MEGSSRRAESEWKIPEVSPSGLLTCCENPGAIQTKRFSGLSSNVSFVKESTLVHLHTVADISENDSEQGLAYFFCKGSDSKYFGFCGMYSFCGNYSTPNCCLVPNHHRSYTDKWLWLHSSKTYFMDSDIWISNNFKFNIISLYPRILFFLFPPKSFKNVKCLLISLAKWE